MKYFHFFVTKSLFLLLALTVVKPIYAEQPAVNTDALYEALFTACRSSSETSTSFFNDCLDALQSSEESLSALTPDEIFANNTNVTSSAINDNFNRMDLLRQFGSRPIGGGASADSIASRFDIYTNGHTSWQEYNRQSLNPGFDLFDSKVMIGADYRFNDNFIAGLTSSYLSSDTTLNQGAGEIDTDGYAFSIYGSYYLNDSFFIDGTFAYADQRHRTTRNIAYGSVSQVASADVDSDTFSAGVVTGYNFFVDGWTITPTARWMYRSIQLDGYTESLSNPGAAGGTLGVAIGDQEYESITGNFGAQVSYAWSQSWGVLMPTLAAEYVHEFSNNSQSVNVRFINAPDGTGGFSIRNSARDRDYATINAGLSAQFARGVSAFVMYEKLLDLNSITSDSLSMGVRLEL
nr:autotransporter outer membrane beta-barrel domain-containing protein [Methylomarinum sp. Ch1-1]MDP4520601.1 autotransporter outer membrane beta-barrel domain-containing protein [Methylomarinum sp. Ch1-1]